MSFDGLFIYGIRGQFSQADDFCDFPHCLHHLFLAAVIDCNVEDDARIVTGDFQGMVHFFLDNGRQPFTGSHEADAHIVLIEFLQFTGEILAQQVHDEPDFRHRPFPVFRRKGIDAEDFDAQMVGKLHDPPQGTGTGCMAEGPGLSLGSGPPAVPIHDDGYMAGNQIRLKHGGIHPVDLRDGLRFGSEA